MLRITISRNGDAAVAYFDEALSKEDYFFAEQEVKAQWKGNTAWMLGLDGDVTRDHFSAVVNNRHPVTGDRITVMDAEHRRAGVEFCFNAPKSVSVALAFTKDPAILEAHRKGVEVAMREIEADMQTQANYMGRKFYQTTGNIAYASFEHFTSRPVKTETAKGKTYIPDMHLHSHVFVPNCTWVESKQRYQAIEAGVIHRLAPYYEALYHSAFSKALEEAHYRVERTPDRWEIKNIHREVIEKFSNRTLEIEKEALAKGITDAKAKGELGARTRVKKSKGVVENQLYKLWEQRLSPAELKAIKSVKHAPKTNVKGITAKEAVSRALEDVLERQSAIPEKRLLGRAMCLGYGHLTADEVKEALAERTDIIAGEKQSITYITTRETLRAENKMIEFASSTKGTVPPLNKNYEIETDYLNEQQRKAITQLLSSQDRVSLLSGRAGVGKTTLLKIVKNGIEQAGKQLFGFAPSANASRGVLRDKGFENADTIAALLQKEDILQACKDQVILIDEAGMVGVKDMQRIFDIAEQSNARVILSGDPRQHNSVNAGDALRQLQEQSQLPVATVDTIVRQNKNEPYKKAVQALADGDTLKGFNKLDKMGAVVEIEDAQERQEAMADAYIQSMEAKRTVMIVSASHAEAETVTQTLREKLKAKGHLQGEEKVYPTNRNLSYTEAQKADPVQYQTGQYIQFHRNAKGGFKAGERYRVVDKTETGKIWVEKKGAVRRELPLEVANRYQIYRETQTPLVRNDLIRVTHNAKTREGTRINNGQTFTIQNFSPEGHIQLSNGKTLDKDFPHYRHGYVHTSFASQGKDAQDVYIAQSALSVPASNEKQFYVSTSRGSENVQVYCDDKAELKKAIIRNTDRMTAQEVAERHRQRQLQTKRRDYYHTEITKSNEYGRNTRQATEKRVPGQEKGLGRE